jgi:hypothetical protein
MMSYYFILNKNGNGTITSVFFYCFYYWTNDWLKHHCTTNATLCLSTFVSHVSICYLNIKFLDPKIVCLTNNLIETGTQQRNLIIIRVLLMTEIELHKEFPINSRVLGLSLQELESLVSPYQSFTQITGSLSFLQFPYSLHI